MAVQSLFQKLNIPITSLALFLFHLHLVNTSWRVLCCMSPFYWFLKMLALMFADIKHTNISHSAKLARCARCHLQRALLSMHTLPPSEKSQVPVRPQNPVSVLLTKCSTGVLQRTQQHGNLVPHGERAPGPGLHPQSDCKQRPECELLLLQLSPTPSCFNAQVCPTWA